MLCKSYTTQLERPVFVGFYTKTPDVRMAECEFKDKIRRTIWQTILFMSVFQLFLVRKYKLFLLESVSNPPIYKLDNKLIDEA